MSFMYEEGRGSIYDSYTSPEPRPKSRPTEVPKEDEEKGFFQSLADLFSGGNDSPAPVSGGRGNVVESRNERSNYINDVVPPSPVSAPPRPQIYDDVLGKPSDDNVFSTRYNPNTENFDVIDNPRFMNTRNKNDITRNIVQYVPPNMRDALMIGGQYDRSVPHAFFDNIGGLFTTDSIGFDDDYQSFGEDLGAYFLDDPIGLGTDVVKGVGEGLYNFVTSPIDTVSGYVKDVYGAATRDQTNRTADQRLGDVFTAGSIIPAVGGAKILGKAAYNSNVSRGLRGDLAEDFYGPDGPLVAPNVGGFKVPENPLYRDSLNAHYDFLKASGLSDYEIESEYGVKAYQTANAPRVVGEVKPSSEVDVSNVPYNVGNMAEQGMKGYGGFYRPKTDEIFISDKTKPSRIDGVIRHEAEHQNQNSSGVGGFKYGAGGMEYAFKLQEKKLQDLNSQIRQETDQLKKQELIAERDDIANIDAGGSYMNSSIERGARQGELDPFNTYDPTVTAAELLDPKINPTNLLNRLNDSLNRAVLPTHGGLSRFREMGPRVPFTNEKLFKGIAEAGVPFANMNMPRTPSTRGNQPVPFISGPDGSADQALYSQSKNPSLADDIQRKLDYLSKKAPVVEYENRKAQMMNGGISGARLQSNLDNLARNLGIERTDR